MAQAKGQTKEKEPATSVSEVYFQVVDDVIESVREDFQSEGVDESVLAELRQLWELKMMQTGAIDTAPPRDANAPPSGKHNSAPMHDLNVPYQGTDEYQTPTMDMLFPPTPQTMTPQVGTPQAMTPVPMTPVPMTPIPMTPLVQQVDPTTLHMAIPAPPVTGGEPVMYQYIPPAPGQAEGGVTFEAEQDVKQEKAAPWMNNKARGVDVNIDMNASYEEGPLEDESLPGQDPVTKDFFTLSTGKRKREDPTGTLSGDSKIPQQDGAGDMSVDREDGAGDLPSYQEGIHGDGDYPKKDLTHSVLTNATCDVERPNLKLPWMRLASVVPQCSSSQILQCDGMDDEYDGVAEEDYNDAGYDEAQSRGDLGSRLSTGDTGDGLSDGEPPLNEDDDNDQGEGDDEPQTDHLVLAQFEKVTRSKNKWKCTLKDGVMHLNKKDILFVRANGEFVF